AAVYARVSTLDQEPENQLQELRRYIEARGWTAVEYVDRGVSGAKDRRQALDRLVTDARAAGSMWSCAGAWIDLGALSSTWSPCSRSFRRSGSALSAWARASTARRPRVSCNSISWRRWPNLSARGSWKG